MSVREFLDKIGSQPDLAVIYSDSTMCIIRCKGAGGERKIRLGFWAVRRMHWEQLVDAFRIPLRISS